MIRFLIFFWRILPFADRFTSRRQANIGALQTFVATVVFAAFHSLMCSASMKSAARKVGGKRFGGGLYRLSFNLQALVSTLTLVAFIFSRPQKVIYRASKTGRLLHWVVQAAVLAVTLWSVKELRFRRFSGVQGAMDAIRGEEKIDEPEAQTPDGDDGRELERGPYKWSRHPVELAPLIFLWATPVLKTNWLGVNIAATFYTAFGIWQQEKRLAAKGSEAWKRYCSRVGMIVGRKRSSESM